VCRAVSGWLDQSIGIYQRAMAQIQKSSREQPTSIGLPPRVYVIKVTLLFIQIIQKIGTVFGNLEKKKFFDRYVIVSLKDRSRNSLHISKIYLIALEKIFRKTSLKIRKFSFILFFIFSLVSTEAYSAICGVIVDKYNFRDVNGPCFEDPVVYVSPEMKFDADYLRSIANNFLVKNRINYCMVDFRIEGAQPFMRINSKTVKYSALFSICENRSVTCYSMNLFFIDPITAETLEKIPYMYFVEIKRENLKKFRPCSE
jgi:hypothetical protein